MAATKAHLKATQKWEQKAYFKTLIRFKKEDEKIIREYAKDSLNGFVVQAVMEKIERMKLEENK